MAGSRAGRLFPGLRHAAAGETGQGLRERRVGYPLYERGAEDHDDIMVHVPFSADDRGGADTAGRLDAVSADKRRAACNAGGELQRNAACAYGRIRCLEE